MTVEHIIGITNVPFTDYQQWLSHWILSENSDDPLTAFQNHVEISQSSTVLTTLNGSTFDPINLSDEIHRQIISHCFSDPRFVNRYFPHQFKKADCSVENEDLLTLFCGVSLYLTPGFLQKLRYSALRTLPYSKTDDFQHIVHQFYEAGYSPDDPKLITLKEHLEDYYWLTKLGLYQKQGWYVFYTYVKEPLDYRHWYDFHEG